MSIGLRTLVLNADYHPISLFPLHTIPFFFGTLCRNGCFSHLFLLGRGFRIFLSFLRPGSEFSLCFLRMDSEFLPKNFMGKTIYPDNWINDMNRIFKTTISYNDVLFYKASFWKDAYTVLNKDFYKKVLHKSFNLPPKSNLFSNLYDFFSLINESNLLEDKLIIFLFFVGICNV